MTRLFFRISGFFILMLVLANLYGMQPAEAAIIGTQEEISMGRDVAKQLEKKYGLVDDPALQERVSRIGAKLVAVCDRKDLPYTFKVLNTKDINALAVPGGFIYVFKGLVDYMPSDEELAGVIGHEVGHVVKRHSVKQIEKSMVMSVLFAVAFGDRAAMLQNLAMNAIMAGYSREDENQADELGFLHTNRAGYNPYSELMTLQKLSDMDKGKGSYSLFSDHPASQARVNHIKGLVAKANIQPGVISDGKTAAVTEGNIKFPAFSVTLGGYKPIYRAYFMAGQLYLATRQPDFQSDRFIVMNDENGASIYYDDERIITLTQQDADAAGISLADLTASFMSAIQSWADTKQQKAAS